MSTSHLMQIRFFTKRRNYEIAISKKWIDQWNLPRMNFFPISFGHRTVHAKILQHKGLENEIWLTPDLAKRLLIPYPDKLWVKRTADSLSIGPIVGIWTTGMSTDLTKPFGLRTSIFIKFLKAQYDPRRGACYFIFNHRSVDWNNLTAEGYFWRQDSTGGGYWEKQIVPFPDVIYNRIPNRFEETRPDTLRFLELVESKTHAKMFNEKFFQKWEVHEKLSQIEEVRQWIPETYSNPNEEVIRSLLDRYKMIYLKPVGGSLGVGIYQLFRDGKTQVIARFRAQGQNVSRRYPSIRSFLYQELSGGKLSRYVAQQGISLISINGFPMDFRVHLNKNIKNEWEITGIGAKLAGKGSVTTHVRTGGKVVSTEQALRTVFQSYAENFLKRLKETCITIALALEKTSNGPLGELGLDIGIDQYGGIWMFEANSKPGRSIFKIRELREKDLYSAGLILDYSTHLTKFA